MWGPRVAVPHQPGAMAETELFSLPPACPPGSGSAGAAGAWRTAFVSSHQVAGRRAGGAAVGADAGWMCSRGARWITAFRQYATTPRLQVGAMPASPQRCALRWSSGVHPAVRSTTRPPQLLLGRSPTKSWLPGSLMLPRNQNIRTQLVQWSG